MTTPNRDTLYSSAVVDLSVGPIKLSLPQFHRYFSVAFLDAYTNNFAFISSRTGLRSDGQYLLVGPHWDLKRGSASSLIRAPNNHIVIIVRIFASSEADYAIVNRLQDEITLTPLVPTPAHNVLAVIQNDPDNFVAVVNQVLRDDPPPAADDLILKKLKPLGIGGNVKSLSPVQRLLWARYFWSAQKRLISESKHVGPTRNGWEYTPATIGNFGVDYKTRATIALRGISASTPEELIYTLANVDERGRSLDDNHAYVLHLRPGMPPVNGFWSLSIYEKLPDGEMFFSENAVHRYSINSASDVLTKNKDGSLDISIQTQRPSDKLDFWLPIPAKHFALIMRAYLPQPLLLDGKFRYPSLRRRNPS